MPEAYKKPDKSSNNHTHLQSAMTCRDNTIDTLRNESSADDSTIAALCIIAGIESDIPLHTDKDSFSAASCAREARTHEHCRDDVYRTDALG